MNNSDDHRQADGGTLRKATRFFVPVSQCHGALSRACVNEQDVGNRGRAGSSLTIICRQSLAEPKPRASGFYFSCIVRCMRNGVLQRSSTTCQARRKKRQREKGKGYDLGLKITWGKLKRSWKYKEMEKRNQRTDCIKLGIFNNSKSSKNNLLGL
eukprot:1156071-Pelagomonas_calceolata.AAC.3